MLKVAVYGKRRYRKVYSDVNLAAAFAAMGKVIQIGCDPKAVPPSIFLGEEPLRPVMNYMRKRMRSRKSWGDISRRVLVEFFVSGPAAPRRDLAMPGRGIVATFQLLEESETV